jgi:hypothetical protein
VTDTAAGVVAEADQLVAGLAPGVGHTPGVETRDVVLVTGPWLAGSTGLIAALRQHLADVRFVEAGELAVTEAPMAIVFVCSAVAPVTASDSALLDLAAANTDLVIGAVSKIDAHRGWRNVLAADREVLAKHAPRYRDVPWVGVAAAPEVGDPNVDELVEVLRSHLDDIAFVRRNRLRAWENHLQTAVRRCEEEAAGVGRENRMTELRQHRGEVLRQGRQAESERTAELRSRMHQAHAQLESYARNRCTSVRSELQEDAAGMTRRRVPAFEEYVGGRVREVIADVNDGVTTQLGDVATELGLVAPPAEPPPAAPHISSPPLKARKQRTRLMLLMGLLGAVLGAGLALALCRLFPNLAPVYTVGAAVAGGVVGFAVAAAVVGMRGRLQDRAVLDRWVDDIVGQLRSTVEQLVTARVPAAESALTAERAQADEAEAARLADGVAAIDAELREHALAAARAAAQRNRDLPGFKAALAAVRRELGTDAPPDAASDAPPDAASDAPPDAGPGAPPDAGTDTGPGAPADAKTDATADPGTAAPPDPDAADEGTKPSPDDSSETVFVPPGGGKREESDDSG